MSDTFDHYGDASESMMNGDCEPSYIDNVTDDELVDLVKEDDGVKPEIVHSIVEYYWKYNRISEKQRKVLERYLA